MPAAALETLEALVSGLGAFFSDRLKSPYMVIALAGRRIDAPGATPARFPDTNITLVEARVRDVFQRLGGTTVVSSAACGADLIALQEAGRLAMRRRVVLAADRDRFRKTSVEDRPGDWAATYDRVIDEVAARGDLVVIQNPGAGDAVYPTANRRILDEAIALGKTAGEPVAAAVIWDGTARGAGDWTEDFRKAAKDRGLEVLEISTLRS